jgi:hypothetical protein
MRDNSKTKSTPGRKSTPARRLYFIIFLAIAVSVWAIIYGCSKGEVIRLTKIAATGDLFGPGNGSGKSGELRR